MAIRASPKLTVLANEVQHGERESHEVIKTTEVRSSYAFIINPWDGLSLTFIAATEIDGLKCAKIEKADVVTKIE